MIPDFLLLLDSRKWRRRIICLMDHQYQDIISTILGQQSFAGAGTGRVKGYRTRRLAGKRGYYQNHPE